MSTTRIIRVRKALLVPGSHRWNGWARDFTAWIERSISARQ